MHKRFAGTAAVLGAVAVGLGAFGAHGLKNLVDAETVQTFQTGVQYQMYHSLALLATALLFEKCPPQFTRIAGTLFITGIILFSGSLYLITLGRMSEMNSLDKAGIITPLGGIAFMAGWLFIFVAALRAHKN